MSAVLTPSRWPRGLFPTVLVLLVVGVAFADHLGGHKTGLAVFYAIPVGMAAWFHSRRLGLAVAFGCVAAWFLVDTATGRVDPGPAITLWNAVVRMAFFVVLTLSVSALRRALWRQEEMVSFIVHDLRAPLAATQLALDELESRLGPSVGEDVREVLQTAQASSKRMAPLIDSLLEAPRLERGKLAVRKAETPVAELAAAAVDRVALWAANVGVTIRQDLAPEAERVWADAELTTRVLVNLLDNAIKHSPEGGTITVGAAANGQGAVTFRVADQGPGIPKAWAKRVFDKYAQGETWGNGASHGTGLGLTFCRLAVERQGGRIWLESTEGKGATMLFTLPPRAEERANVDGRRARPP